MGAEGLTYKGQESWAAREVIADPWGIPGRGGWKGEVTGRRRRRRVGVITSP